MKLDNLRILTGNMPQMFAFYKDTIGLKPTWGDAESTYASFADENGKTALALFDRTEMLEALGMPDKPTPEAPRTGSLLVFEIEQVEVFYAEKAQAGASFLAEPRAMPDWGIRVAHLIDPDGNLVEIFSNMPKEAWSEELLSQAPNEDVED
jgi:predicted enzyme related to lactoylglutathione lyase